MNAELGERIDQLRRLTTAELQIKYRELFGQASHSNHKDYLFRRLAWRLQSLAERGLSERARQCAREIAEDADLRLCAPNQLVGSRPVRRVANASRQIDPRVPAPGTQLIKRYKNETMRGAVPELSGQFAQSLMQTRRIENPVRSGPFTCHLQETADEDTGLAPLREGYEVGTKKVRRLMKEDNLLAVRRRKFVATTDSDHDFVVYPNLAEQLIVSDVNQLWVADLTYVRL